MSGLLKLCTSRVQKTCFKTYVCRMKPLSGYGYRSDAAGSGKTVMYVVTLRRYGKKRITPKHAKRVYRQIDNEQEYE